MSDKIEKITAFAAIIIWLGANARYCEQIVSGSITPTLATWLIFGMAGTLSLASYLKHSKGRQPFVANAANRLDPIVVWTIVLFVAFSPKLDTHFGSFDILCLGAVALILSVWAITRSALVANLLIQTVMVAGYLPTFHRIFHERRNTEPFATWGPSLVVGFLFLVAPLRKRDKLGIVYSVRAIVSVASLLAVMTYFHFFGPR